ncbi:MAG: ABC transporter permease [Fibrobacteraceae bacterium]|nr:ABC transporter permease [Fibrobacteraceae bacterium]
MSFLLKPFRFIGQMIVDGISSVGELCCILWFTLREMPNVHKNGNLVIKQMVSIGVSSVPLLFVTSIFTGMVATVQASFQFRGLVADKWVGTAACKMILIELGPLLTALVLAGRVGSALAAEIASMREKEELAAYEVLGLDPYRYLALPRFVAFFTMVPCLTVISNCLAIFGGWIVAVLALDISTYTFYSGMQYLFDPMDLFSGIIKSFVFGVTIFLLGWFHGTNAAPGARGVGLATKDVVVSSCLMILILDLAVAAIIFQ